MAKKKTTVSPDPGAPQNQLSARVVFNLSDETATYYVNAVEVGQSFYEFALLFGKVPAKLPATQLEAVRSSKQLELVAALQILIPPTLIPGLIYALSVERRKYEELHGVKLPELSPSDIPEGTNAH